MTAWSKLTSTAPKLRIWLLISEAKAYCFWQSTNEKLKNNRSSSKNNKLLLKGNGLKKAKMSSKSFSPTSMPLWGMDSRLTFSLMKTTNIPLKDKLSTLKMVHIKLLSYSLAWIFSILAKLSFNFYTLKALMLSATTQNHWWGCVQRKIIHNTSSFFNHKFES